MTYFRSGSLVVRQSLRALAVLALLASFAGGARAEETLDP